MLIPMDNMRGNCGYIKGWRELISTQELKGIME
jgi:hypothetical protein